ncbi:MAG: signal peptidase I [Anaerolineae bacterium]|jgi:signal peptidase
MFSFSRSVRAAFTTVFLSLLALGGLMLVAPHMWDIDFRTVVSGSMEPTIPVGSVVAVRPVDATTIRPGDVISFKSPENPTVIVTHRVIRTTYEGTTLTFHTQGDANYEPDLEPVPASNVLGRVWFCILCLGYLTQIVRTHQGWLLLVVVPGAILVLIEFIRIIRVIWADGGGSSLKSEAADEQTV